MEYFISFRIYFYVRSGFPKKVRNGVPNGRIRRLGSCAYLEFNMKHFKSVHVLRRTGVFNLRQSNVVPRSCSMFSLDIKKKQTLNERQD